MKVFIPRDAAVRAVGSRGLFWLEPMIEVETADGRIGFGPLAVRDVPALVTGRFDRGHPLCVGKPEEIPFLKRRTRITFARRGIIDPLALDDYRARGGWRGLERAQCAGRTQPAHRQGCGGVVGCPPATASW